MSGLNLNGVNDDLFYCLAEQLKIPLVQISSLSESDSIKKNNKINEISNATLRLIDGFILSSELSDSSQFDLEPVAIGSLMYDVSQEINNYAKIYKCELNLDISNKCGLIMSNYRALHYALVNIGFSFINALSSKQERSLRLTASINKDGVTAGIYVNSSDLGKELFIKSKSIKGKTYLPIQKFTSASIAGIFVADSILETIGSELKLSRNKGEVGLVTSLMKSNQLSLV